MYELLNDIEVDIKDDDLAPVSGIEKKKLSKDLKQKIISGRKQNKWKRALSVAILAFGMMTSAMIGLSFTAYAEDIPFLGNIFKFFSSDGTYAGYDENAKKLDLVQESNGIKISVMDTVFDGKTLFVTYMIESDKDLGEWPSLNSLQFFKDSGSAGSQQMSKIEEGKYISVLAMEPFPSYDRDEIDVNWKIASISTEPNSQGTVFEGSWEFEFNVKAVETETVVIDETIDEKGITFTAEKITFTPMSFILNFQYISDGEIRRDWDSRHVWVEVKDDLGNTYKELTGAGSGKGSDYYGVRWYTTFEKIDPKATTLTIIPIVRLMDYDTIGYSKSGKPIKANGRSVDSKADYKEFQLEEIVIDLK